MPREARKIAAQSAMKYLTAYGWVVIILVVILAAIYGTGLMNPSAYTSTTPSTISATISYIYCVGTQSTPPYNQIYYAKISSTGIGTWSATPSYPLPMSYVYCRIFGSGGGGSN